MRTRITAAIASLALSVAVLPAPAISQEGGSGGKNVVMVTNETDDRTASRAGVLATRAAGPTAVPENLASARSSCTGCRTVAVAMQVVLVISDPEVASPHNAAVAVNAGCTNCATMAYAWQYVVSTDGPVTVSRSGQATISRVRTEAADLAASNLGFADLEAQLDALAAELRDVADNEVQRAGVQHAERTGRQVELDQPSC